MTKKAAPLMDTPERNALFEAARARLALLVAAEQPWCKKPKGTTGNA